MSMQSSQEHITGLNFIYLLLSTTRYNGYYKIYIQLYFNAH
jgi:hypothetical protein